ncbi:ribonuclease HII [Roseospira visakhapatnamensis]|uniref:Ribonuclease HII n=1 Tax=Roseospira visakhapatnamensis TaxID=390880 RepID=A0A7W6RB14_9PROT|nr:ribonuclease HII [Roseospira visakhapatnamensis]MBB4265223.1 ribonuclease HII [Roseospira visakhapatnamensis]
MPPDFVLEQTHDGLVCGLDEAGRGPLAGPVVAGAAILDPARLPPALREGLDDSKALSAARREILFALLTEEPGVRIGVGVVEAADIDRLNIRMAALLAMRRAFEALGTPVPTLALVDGRDAPALPCAVQPVIKGDARSLSIAAASIIAKVTRDRIVRDLAPRYPGYGWETNMGYPTREHLAALRRQGVTDQHRRSFGPVRAAIAARDGV